MKIRFTELQSSAQHKAGELKAQEYDLPELIIGRGGRSTIVISDRSLSLEHAQLFETPDGRLGIRDLGSLNGVRVNGQLHKERVLSARDVVVLGALSFTLLIDGEWWVLLHELEAPPAITDIQSLHKRLSITQYLPSNTILSGVTLLILSGAYILWPLLSKSGIEQYSVGKLTSHHVFIGKDCASCHAQPFEPVNDAACATCHAVSPHFDSVKHPPHGFSRVTTDGSDACMTCHTEHKGTVTHATQELCSSCHATIEKIPDVAIKNVRSWDAHPEFRVQEDPGTVKLNHAVHLKAGILGDKGPETLTCSSCHTMDPVKQKMLPISYEANCARCHSLEFDERLPGFRVPHGDVDGVLSYLRGTYAQFALSKSENISKGDMHRLKKSTTVEPPKFVEASVAAEIDDAEKLLFTKTGCVLCHQIQERDALEIKETKGSRYTITKSLIPSSWFSKAIFAHGSHGQLSCETCHGDVKQSKETRDVLMPARKDCVECHTTSSELSNCSTCHSYHEALPLHDSREKIKE